LKSYPHISVPMWFCNFSLNLCLVFNLKRFLFRIIDYHKRLNFVLSSLLLFELYFSFWLQLLVFELVCSGLSGYGITILLVPEVLGKDFLVWGECVLMTKREKNYGPSYLYISLLLLLPPASCPVIDLFLSYSFLFLACCLLGLSRPFILVRYLLF